MDRVTGLLEGPSRADVRQERFASLRDRNKFRLLTHTTTTREGRSYPGAAGRSGDTGVSRYPGGLGSVGRLDRGSLGGCGPGTGLQPPIGSTTRQRTRSGRPDTRLFDRYPLTSRHRSKNRLPGPGTSRSQPVWGGLPLQTAPKPAPNRPVNASRPTPDELCRSGRVTPPNRTEIHPKPEHHPAPPTPTTPTPNKTVTAQTPPRDPHSCALAWSSWWESRVGTCSDPEGTPKALFTPTNSTSTLTAAEPANHPHHPTPEHPTPRTPHTRAPAQPTRCTSPPAVDGSPRFEQGVTIHSRW